MLNHCLKSGGGNISGFYGMLFWLFLIILSIGFVVYLFSKKNIVNTQNELDKDSIYLLNERFIRGEISEEEFIKMKQILQK